MGKTFEKWVELRRTFPRRERQKKNETSQKLLHDVIRLIDSDKYNRKQKLFIIGDIVPKIERTIKKENKELVAGVTKKSRKIIHKMRHRLDELREEKNNYAKIVEQINRKGKVTRVGSYVVAGGGGEDCAENLDPAAEFGHVSDESRGDGSDDIPFPTRPEPGEKKNWKERFGIVNKHAHGLGKEIEYVVWDNQEMCEVSANYQNYTDALAALRDIMKIPEKE